MVFAVDKKGLKKNSAVSPLTKILVNIDLIQGALLGGSMKTTTTGIIETWVQRLVNNIVFQFRRVLDTSPGKLITHYRISPFVCIGELFWSRYASWRQI